MAEFQGVMVEVTETRFESYKQMEVAYSTLIGGPIHSFAIFYGGKLTLLQHNTEIAHLEMKDGKLFLVVMCLRP